jgi:putative nucleotidyltransferase with HDIG domain
VLSSSRKLETEDIAKLYLHRIDYVEIKPRVSIEEQWWSEMAKSAPAPYKQEQLEAFDSAVQGIHQTFEQVRIDGRIDDKQVNESFEPLIDHFLHEVDVVTMLLTLNGKDDYTYHHSVQVGMLSYLISKWLGDNEEQALLVGKAGYLHDIGKSRIDEAILKKPGRLTNEEYNIIKQHTVIGHEMVQQSFDSPELALGALQHHERLNGTGYPHGILGKDMHPISKIIAVADIYSAMISTRVYKDKQDLLTVLKELYRSSFGELDPHITHMFITNMLPSFIGKKLTLTNGDTGVIIMTNANDYFRPLIRIGHRYINLSTEHKLEIQHIYT